MKDGPSGPLRPGWRELPAPGRLALDHPRRAEILERHERALRARLSTYLDPATGFTVLTAQYLADRGYCCSAGCRHCPWTEAWEHLEALDPRPAPPDEPDAGNRPDR